MEEDRQAVPESGHLDIQPAESRGALETIVSSLFGSGGKKKPPTTEGHWLDEFRSGKSRQAWFEKAFESLEKMLSAKATQERLRSALVLAGLGRDEKAVPVLLDVVRADPRQHAAAGAVLPWLPIAARLATFDELLKLKPTPDETQTLVGHLAQWDDPAAAEPLWKLLAAEKLDHETLMAAQEALRTIYRLEFRYIPTASDRQNPEPRPDDIAAVERRAVDGTLRERCVALLLLLDFKEEAVPALAAKIFDDRAVAPEARRDAFQLALRGWEEDEARKAAAEKLADEVLRKPALVYLVHGEEALHTAYDQSEFSYLPTPDLGNPQPIEVKAPEGVASETVRPLISDPDPQTAALAGYLLATLKEESGLPPLVAYWRAQPASEAIWQRAVYRAVSALDNPRHLPLLEEIYAALDDESLPDFYWTIRTMKGPELQEFRKRVRDERGASALQGNAP
jgi:hypothetical protein